MHSLGGRGAASVANDFQTGIVFDARRLTLLEQDHVWLSHTPRREKTKSWGSIGSRTMTVAVFKVVGTGGDGDGDGDGLGVDDTDSGGEGQIVLMFNTHLDVWGAEARVQQAKMVAGYIRRWRARWPGAAVFLTGDFNTANGHPPHKVLVGPPNGPLVDVWDQCMSASASVLASASSVGQQCRTNQFAGTFHGWLGGTAINSYGARVVQFLAQTVHASGIDFPKRVPGSARELIRMVRTAAQDACQ